MDENTCVLSPYRQLVVPVRRQLQRDDDLVTERGRLLVPQQLVDGVQLPGHQGEVVQDRRPVDYGFD